MSGRKISQLDPALPLTGDEFLPIVQDGITRKIKVSDLLRAAFGAGNIKSRPYPVIVDGQTEFQLLDEVDEVEQIFANGQSVNSSDYSFSKPTLTFVSLPYQLETTDTLLVVYSTRPQAIMNS